MPKLIPGKAFIVDINGIGGKCITSTCKGSVIWGNRALCSRFLFSAGSDVVIEDNAAVYDPADKAAYPGTPRINIGFRMYVSGNSNRVANNTFIGFAQGALINKPRNIGDHVDIRGNAFHGFTDYALRVHEPAAVASDDNLYVPAGTNTSPVYLTPTQTNKVHLTLSEWRAKGFDAHSRMETTGTPVVPAVLRSSP